MPTFTAIALDRLLEPGAPKSMRATKSVPDTRLDRRNSTPVRVDRGVDSGSTRIDRGVSIPPRLEKGTSLPSAKKGRKYGVSAPTVGRTEHWTQISPALYATPKPTPIPDSPSAFSPSPYVVNHKRRGPRLLKSHSVDDVATNQRGVDNEKVDGSIPRRVVASASADFSTPSFQENDSFDSVQEVHANSSVTADNQANGTFDYSNKGNVKGNLDTDPQACEKIHNSDDQSNTLKTTSFSFQVKEVDEVLDRHYSVSEKSNKENGVVGEIEQSTNSYTPMPEFYDAWEDLSNGSDPQQQPAPDIEAELREIRLSLLMEIEKRKQAEESFNTMCIHWQKFRSQLSSVGLTLPADPLAVRDNERLEDSAEELCQQVYLARFVSNSIGRGIAKAEVEMKMEAQLEFKNFEISRLSDRLHYYEAVNREMSQRNQEAVDNARRLREQRREKRKKWVWGSVAAAITIGSAVLAWSYVSTSTGTPSSRQSHASVRDHPSES